MGNPISYNNGSTYTMTWTGRHLDSVTTGGVTTTYEYDSTGMRTTKIVGNKTYEYLYYGGKLVRYSADGEGYLYFYYDDNGSPLGFTYEGVNGTADYYYVLNLQGDIVQVRNSSGSVYANYSYDAWGKLLSVTNASGNVITDTTHIALLNPLRYRGYVYDTETGFYYLQSRYYDPTIGRFINADGLVSTGTGVLGYNMFAYCNNNPVMNEDSNGHAVTEWDKNHLTETNLKLLNDYTIAWNNAETDTGRNCYHNLAIGVRAPFLSEGEFVGEDGNVYCDITSRLCTEMIINRLALSQISILLGDTIARASFAFNVRSGGEWDLKYSWNLDEHVTYIFNGLPFRFDAIGNIHYGYVGSCLFQLPELLIAGGIVQQLGASADAGEWYSFGDDPYDTFTIIYGYMLAVQ